MSSTYFNCTIRRSVLLARMIFTLLFFSQLLSSLQAKAVVVGRMSNATLGDRIELYVPHFYIDNEASSYKAQINAAQEFSFEVEVPEPQIVFLIFGQDQVVLFLEPNDTLFIKSDIFQFPITVEFGGRGGANNRFFRSYLPLQTADYNEFNNVRFKVGQWWFPLETTINDTMLVLPPNDFINWSNAHLQRSFLLYDQFMAEHPDALTRSFREWIESEIIFSRAYNLLMYGMVYKNRYSITANYFDFLYEIPMVVNAVGSEPYRQFLQVYMAREQTKSPSPDTYYAGQYKYAGTVLEGKALAYFQSEVIRMAFSSDRLKEILPAYTDFMKNNRFPGYESKIVPLYERTSRFAPGMIAPSFAGKDFYTSQIISNESLRGKVVYINFWATWCGACIKKMNLFNAFAPELKAEGIEIVNISMDEEEASWKNMLTENQQAGWQLLARSYPEQVLGETFGVQAVPQYFILDKKGAIAEKPYSTQPNDIIKKLQDLAKH